MATFRSDRRNEEVKKTISEVIREMKDPRISPMTALTEAAVAWRGGDPIAAHGLAMAAFREWSAAGRRWAQDMARALALACGGEAQPGEVAALTSEALACPVPMAGLQVLARTT